VKEIWYNDTQAYEYAYTDDGQVHKIENLLSETVTLYKYDTNNRVIGVNEYTATDAYNDLGITLSYDEQSRVDSMQQTLRFATTGGFVGTYRLQYTYHYDKNDGKINKVTMSGTSAAGNINYTYDAFDRLVTKLYGNVSNSYTYKDSGNNTTAQVATHTITVGGTATTATYTYDANGNITKILYSNGKEVRYVYDDLSQLVREDNGLTNKTYIYTYDNAGNIQSKSEYALTAAASTPITAISTKIYGYADSSWGDLLTSYNGTTITYDGMGNPLSYYNGVSYTFSWDGRNLVGATLGSNTYTFTYNDQGQRVTKTKNGVTTRYYWSGSLLLAEETNGNVYIYLYDEQGSPIGFQYRAANYSETTVDTYWYEKNLQGDIVAVYNSSGTKLISYTYTAWGECIPQTFNGGNNTAAANNPMRYRGYYYDTDLQLYYLISRYYDARVGRFISPDLPNVLSATPTALTDKNLYAYCDNNPVMRVDGDGEFWNVIVGGLVGIASQFVSDIITSAIDGEFSISHWSEYVGAAIGGAIGSIIPGGDILKDVVGAAVTTVTSAISYNIANYFNGKSDMYSFEEIYYTTVNNVFIAAAGGFLFENSKVGKAISGVAKDFCRGFSSSVLDGVANSKGFNYPNMHLWDEPEAERWYPFR